MKKVIILVAVLAFVFIILKIIKIFSKSSKECELPHQSSSDDFDDKVG